MKSLIILTVVLLAEALASPVPAHKWEMTPDGLGNMHLVDLDPVDPVEIEPQFNANTDVILTLFTPQNRLIGQRLLLTAASIRNSNFNAAWPTRFTIHGWTSGASDNVNTNVRSAYFNNGNFNMITVDWSAGASTLNYALARGRVGAVGGFVARFIDLAHQNGFLQFSTTHVIGHSLGAHAAGHAGKAVTRGRVQVIYGLDPAGPLFFTTSNDRIHQNDGVYVETLITNGGDLGFMGNLGHANFFPNHGSTQPGCSTSLCHHMRATTIYVDSINRVINARSCTWANIQAGRCPAGVNSVRVAGPNPANLSLRGSFFWSTGSSAPF